MKCFITTYRDQAGYHREFHGTMEEAKQAVASYEKSRENWEASGFDHAQDFSIKKETIITDKKHLLNWLNANCDNADSF